MNHQRLITFKIDPNLDRMWRMIGLTQSEKSEEAQRLESIFYTAYQQFIQDTSHKCEELRVELRKTQEEFNEIQKIYGDTSSILQSNSTLPLRDQIELAKSSIIKLHENYHNRAKEFELCYERLNILFDRLGIQNDERGEFNEIGNTDLTEVRLNRFKKQICVLDELTQQRENLFASLENRITSLSSELKEKLDDYIRQLIETESITDESLQMLQEEEERLEEMKKQRQEESEELMKEIQHYYLIFAVDPADQIEIQTDLSENTINKLQEEVEFLQQNRETRIPQVLKGLNKEIQNVCESLKIPLRLRPKYKGRNQDEEILYLTEKLDELKKEQIQMQPIISVITQIENARDIINQTSTINPRQRGSSKKMLEEEKAKKKAKEDLPKLENKLLQLLIQFRQEHGYDFEFNGINYTRSYVQGIDSVTDTKRIPRKNLDTTVPNIGRQLLLQKINESSQNTNTTEQFKKTARRTKRQQTLLNLQSRSPFS